MFLESSRSKFIGYTLGRWVSAEPAEGATSLGGLLNWLGLPLSRPWLWRSPVLALSGLG